jgi:hypothetical protein
MSLRFHAHPELAIQLSANLAQNRTSGSAAPSRLWTGGLVQVLASDEASINSHQSGRSTLRHRDRSSTLGKSLDQIKIKLANRAPTFDAGGDGGAKFFVQSVGSCGDFIWRQ